MRFQELMPDIFHWLGITHIHRFASMSDMKFNALAKAGISVGERIEIPPELIPADAAVEMEAKKAAGYFARTEVKTNDQLKDVKGRKLEE
jgi:GTP cyclohydrolase II